MKNKIKSRFAVLSLSGGMDSSTVLLKLLSENYAVTCLSFDYGQKHKIELEKATDLVAYINNKIMDGMLSIPIIKHQIIKLDGLSKLLNSSLVEGGKEVPEGHYAQDNMKETFVPNRNKIFNSIIQAVALSIADENNTECFIASGIHSGDHAIYPDCRQEFRDADFEAFKLGNWNSDKVKIYTPYLNTDKFGILQDGEKCCNQLGFDFDQIYLRTNTSYKPINNYSDYKSSSSVERIEAFIKLGRPDPITYADETGIVSWEYVKNHALEVLSAYKG